MSVLYYLSTCIWIICVCAWWNSCILQLFYTTFDCVDYLFGNEPHDIIYLRMSLSILIIYLDYLILSFWNNYIFLFCICDELFMSEFDAISHLFRIFALWLVKQKSI